MRKPAGEDLYALSSSGGKDSTFALYQSQKEELNVKYILHLYNIDDSRVRFHGYRKEVIKEQARAMGMKSLVRPVHSNRYYQDFKNILRELKKKRIKGLITGEINLEDCREYNESAVKEVGLQYYTPLWKKSPKLILEDFINQGFKAVICSVWLEKLNKKYLGRKIDKEFLRDILKEKNVDPCGEKGEYHSLVYDGPCFKKPLEYKEYGVHKEKNNIFLDLRV